MISIKKNNLSSSSAASENRVAIVSNTSWYLFNFRISLIRKLINDGHKVIAIAPFDEFSGKLEDLGCKHYHIKINSKSKNPFMDIFLTLDFIQIFRRARPAVLLNFTAKPNIYATIAGKALGIPAINNIAGLGSGFVEESTTTKILRMLYGYSQKKVFRVFFQNEDDYKEFLSNGIVHPEKASILPGSGVDLQRFRQCVLPTLTDENGFTFLLISRVLYSKGIELLYNAAKEIYKDYHNFKVQVVGQTGVNNSDAIPVSKINEWNQKPFFEYLGQTDDIRPYIGNCHCIVLPSYYREGTPKSILEGLAMGRPVITTDMPGCRTTVIEGKNGFLIKPRDVHDLEQSMRKMMGLTQIELQKMAHKSRELAEQQFDEQIVIKEYGKNIHSLLN